MKSNSGMWIVVCVGTMCIASGCEEKPAMTRTGAPSEITAWYTHVNDIEIRKNKISASVKKPDPADAKAAAGIGGKFPTAISAFNEFGAVTLSGGVSSDGFISFIIKGGGKPDDGDYFNWKQYVPMLQAMLGISAKDANGVCGVGITTQLTINATMSISVSGWSAKHKAMIGETHTISSPVLFSAKNGKITLCLPDECKKSE